MNLLKTLLKRKVLMFILVGFVFFLGFLFHFNLKSGIENDMALLTANATFLSPQEEGDSPSPVRLKIPKINADAAIEYVGLTPDGAMDVPKGPAEAAWYELGPRPGEIGSAVVAGHSGYKDKRPAVFDNLHKLKKGDKIYVEDEKGATITFVVRELKTYDKDENVPEVFVSNDGLSHLNLVTCTGVWNIKEKTRSRRLVVFTDKEVK